MELNMQDPEFRALFLEQLRIVKAERLKKLRRTKLRENKPHCGTLFLGDDYWCAQCGAYHYPASYAVEVADKRRRMKAMLRSMDDFDRSLEDDECGRTDAEIEELDELEPEHEQNPSKWLHKRPRKRG